MTDHAAQRLKITVEYFGTPFHGWQRQPGGLPTVQGHLEAAWHKVTGETVTLCVAGRTDAGVHGIAQVCHVDTQTSLPPRALKVLLNRQIPNDIVVHHIDIAPADFHARFSAVERRYVFKLLCQKQPSALYRHHTTHVPYTLDIDKMKIAAGGLIGEQDFSAFRTAECSSSTPMCHIKQADFYWEGHILCFEITADHFLHNMIRIITGTLIDIGRGKLPTDTIKQMILNGNRSDGGPTIPPHGLYFKSVTYPL